MNDVMEGGAAGLATRLRGLSARRSGLAVCLCGEAGIGKTFTARALLGQTPCRSLTLPCSAPLALLAGALPEPERWPAWTERAARRLRQAGETAPEQAAAALLGQLATLVPFVLHLEDLHEADAARLTLVRALARGARHTRGLGLLLTGQTPPPEELEVVYLGRLPMEAARTLLEERAGAALPAGRCRVDSRARCRQPAVYAGILPLSHPPGRAVERRAALAFPGTCLADVAVHRRSADRTGAAGGGKHGRPTGHPRGGSAAGRGPPALWARVVGDPAAFGAAWGELIRRGVLLRDDFVHPLYREMTPRPLCGQSRGGPW